MSNITVVLVGGGTGGHFYPLISIAESFRSDPTISTNLYYMGPDPYDKEMLERNSIRFVSCPAGKRRKYFSLKNYIDIFKTLFGIVVALVKLYIIYPDVIISKGGFTSVPVVIAGGILAIPIIVHESDSLPGSANKLGAKFARHIFVSYVETAQFFNQKKTMLTGIPIRNELRAPVRANAHELLNIDTTRPLILILGGSQGAERLNELILDALDELLPTYSVLHQTGEKLFNIVSGSARELIPDPTLFKHYHPVPFLDASLLNDALHTAAIVISRAGSTSIYEIALHGKPAILIPIPGTVSHDQRTNAFTYAKSGGATVIEEANFSDGLLTAEIARIMENPDVYRGMSEGALGFGRTDASENIAGMGLEIAETHA